VFDSHGGHSTHPGEFGQHRMGSRLVRDSSIVRSASWRNCCREWFESTSDSSADLPVRGGQSESTVCDTVEAKRPMRPLGEDNYFFSGNFRSSNRMFLSAGPRAKGLRGNFEPDCSLGTGLIHPLQRGRTCEGEPSPRDGALIRGSGGCSMSRLAGPLAPRSKAIGPSTPRYRPT